MSSLFKFCILWANGGYGQNDNDGNGFCTVSEELNRVSVQGHDKYVLFISNLYFTL